MVDRISEHEAAGPAGVTPIEGPARVVFAHWAVHGGDVGWEVATGRDGAGTFKSIGSAPPLALHLPVAPSDPDPRPPFDAWLLGSSLRDWWLQNAGREGDAIVVLRGFPDSVWQIPWELLVAPLTQGDNHHRVALARGIVEAIPEAPDRFDEALRVLMLTGRPDGLLLAVDVELLLMAWESLGDLARRRIVRPEHAEARRADLPELVRRHSPHVLWFSGHGRIRDETELLFADGAWVGASEFIELLERSQHVPLYAVFSACDTGRVPLFDAGQAFTPDLFARLRHLGVVEAVVTQSPIRDDAARIVTHELFAHLAGGYSLPVALARARAQLLDEARDDPTAAHALDWAAPVMWTSGTPVAALEWHAGGGVRAQLLGERLLRSAFRNDPAEARVDLPADESEHAHATAWLNGPRTWVAGDLTDPEQRVRFLRILHAIQSSAPLAVLLIPAEEDPTGVALQHWAEDAYRWLRPGRLPPDLVERIGYLRSSALAGWPRLAVHPGLCLAVTDPPPSSEDWFWGPLTSSRAEAPVVLLCPYQPLDDMARWNFDSLTLAVAPEQLAVNVAAAPRLARALAALRVLVTPEHAELTGPAPGEVARIGEWPDADEVLIKARGRVAMSSAARAQVQATASEAEWTQANWDAVTILAKRESQSVEDASEILHHLLAAGREDSALLVASRLIQALWHDGRAARALAIVKELGDRAGRLSPKVAHYVADAYVGLLHVDDAERWLRRAEPGDAIERARVESLWAQVEKARGTPAAYDAALKHIKTAVAMARKAADAWGIRNYRQDQALILLWDFDRPGEAVEIYRELVDEIEAAGAADPTPALDRQLAVVKKNYAESLARLGGQSGVNLVAQLDEARRLTEGSMAPVRAEILYALAKLAQDERDETRWLDKCIAVSAETGHVVMKAIAENRRWWLQTDFSAGAWKQIEAQLEDFQRNAWAARTLVKGRLRAARALQQEDRTAAIAQLNANRTLFETLGIATAGQRDRLRIAQTYAGLAVLSDDHEPWDRLLAREWVPNWLVEQRASRPAELWEREVE